MLPTVRGAVFLSYAREDTDAARRVADALKSAGVEVWFDQDELVGQLAVMKESLREEYRVGKTLAEQLADAVASEEYERAARLRDEIARRRGGPR